MGGLSSPTCDTGGMPQVTTVQCSYSWSRWWIRVHSHYICRYYPTRGSGWYAGGQDYSSERPGQAGNGLVETSWSSAKTNAKSCLRNGKTMCNCAGWGHLVEKGLAVPVNSKLHSKPLHQIKTNTLGWISKSVTSRSREVISSSIQQLLDCIPGAACPVLFSLVKERHSHTRTSPVKDHQTRGLEPRVNQLAW